MLKPFFLVRAMLQGNLPSHQPSATIATAAMPEQEEPGHMLRARLHVKRCFGAAVPQQCLNSRWERAVPAA